MKPTRGRLALAGAWLWLLLVLPPVRHLLESRMTLQMLVQIPLCVLAGWWLAQAAPRRLLRALARWNHAGITGLVLASLAGMVWMLPLAMDAALHDPRFWLAKFLGVPLLIGAPLAFSWPRAGFVVRGVFLLELTAVTFRLGWLYLISPERLCSNYLLGDQQWLGKLLIAIGCAITLVLAWKLMWGHVRVAHAERGDSWPGQG